MLEIPIASVAPHFTQEHQLFGNSYLLEFEWIEREKFWTLHLYDGLERPIAFGLRLIHDWPVFLDPKRRFFLLLLAKKPNSALDLTNLKTAFMLVAREFV